MLLSAILPLFLATCYAYQIQSQEHHTFVDRSCIFGECVLNYEGPFYEDVTPADELRNFTLYCIQGTAPGELWTQKYDFSASQTNLIDYAAITSMEFDFNAISVYVELDGNKTLLDSGDDIRNQFNEEVGSTWSAEKVAHIMHVVSTKAMEAKVVWNFAARSRSERFCLRTIGVIPDAVVDDW